MSLPIENIVEVSITRETSFPTGPGFGTLLILDTSTVITTGERVRSYSSLAGLTADFSAATEVNKAATAAFAQNPRITTIKVGRRDSANAVGVELDAVVAVDDDWYGLILTADQRISDDATVPAAAATWVEARNKLFVTATNEAGALSGGGGLPATLSAASLNRTGIFYHQDADADAVNAYPEAAFFGQMLTVDFDGVNTTKTGDMKTLAGITASPLTQSQYDFLRGNNAMTYVDVAGRNVVRGSSMASGEWFDVMHGIDWLQSEIAFRVYGRLATMNKVPYTNAGMEILAAEVRGALQQGVNNGLLASRVEDGVLVPGFEVTVPDVLTASLSDRSNRIAPPISFAARLAGAVHNATVNGTITV